MTASRSSWQNLRRVFLWAIIISFALAALAGIAVLLGAELGDTGVRVIGSTTAVGAYGLAMLCCAAVFDRAERMIGVAGVAVSALSLAFSLVLIWSETDWDWWLWQGLFTGTTLTIALSFASLLLALTRYRDKALRVLIPVTLALFALATALVLFAVWEGPGIDSELFGRGLGIVLILAVLCGVVTPILSTLRGRAGEQPTTPAPDSAGAEESPVETGVSPEPERLDPRTAAALEAEAQRRGVTVAELVAPLFKE